MDAAMPAAGDAGAAPPAVVLVSAGASHSVALLSGNVLCSWGRGEDGQLGHGDAEDRLVPTVLSGFDAPGITSVICGADHTTAYSEEEQQVYSWGWGDFGRLGHGNSSDVFTPQPVKALQGIKIKQIACGDSHCLAVTMAGEVQSWGRNQNGQLGLGTTEDSLLPQKIQAFEGICVKMIAAGAEHTAAITEDGDLYGWGWGRYGNLGLGDRNDRLIPEKVSSVEGEKMVLVACGWRHTINVSSSGSLYTYGWSKYGQLGHGDFEDHLVPHKVEALKDSSISQISGGWRHTMALTSDGKLYGWGWNKFGQVGARDNVDHCSPVQLNFPEEQKVAQVACGWRHTLAFTEKKNVFAWGRGTSGQLGHGRIVDRNTPVIIDALSPDGSGCKKLESSTSVPFAGMSEIVEFVVYYGIGTIRINDSGSVDLSSFQQTRLRMKDPDRYHINNIKEWFTRAFGLDPKVASVTLQAYFSKSCKHVRWDLFLLDLTKDWRAWLKASKKRKGSHYLLVQAVAKEVSSEEDRDRRQPRLGRQKTA